mgnify:CR=1 FL=1
MTDINKWRLPTKGELIELYKSGRFTISISYWSSTTYASDPSYAWVVGFYGGPQYSFFKTDSRYVRCVKTKKGGKLKWQKNESKSIMNWYEAMKYAEGLNNKHKIKELK